MKRVRVDDRAFADQDMVARPFGGGGCIGLKTDLVQIAYSDYSAALIIFEFPTPTIPSFVMNGQKTRFWIRKMLDKALTPATEH